MNGSTSATKAEMRERLIEAVVAETDELGHAGVTVEQVLRRAGVGRDTFSAHLEDPGAALAAAAQLRAGEAKRLPALAPEITELLFTYYLGREAAAELATAAPVEVPGSIKRVASSGRGSR